MAELTESGLNLRKRPIIEAVVDIECDFSPTQSLRALEESARLRFASDYPKFRLQFLQELRIQLKEAGPLTDAKRHDVQASAPTRILPDF